MIIEGKSVHASGAGAFEKLDELKVLGFHE